MRRLTAMAKETFIQCLRTKVAVTFVLLVAITLGVLPFVMTGDGTLAGTIRTFLSYSTSLTALLLSVATILLAVGTVSGDVQRKHVFLLASKPLARWQYLLGRWIGIAILNAVLLGGASVAIYSVAAYLRTRQDIGSSDRQQVEAEIFTARKKVAPVPPDIDAMVERRIEELRKENLFQDALSAYVARADGDREKALAKMTEEIRRQITKQIQSVRPGGAMRWRFEGVHARGQQITGQGEIAAISQSRRALRVKTSPDVLGHLIVPGPVRVNNIEGRVDRINTEENYFDVHFGMPRTSGQRIENMRKGQTVPLEIDPTFQISYKPNVAGYVPNNTIECIWRVLNPTTGAQQLISRSDPPEVTSTITLSGRLVNDRGKTVAQFFNMLQEPGGEGKSITIAHDDIFALYRVGGFGGNFTRGMLLIWIQLLFLSALGVLAGSFLSAPVGILLCFVILPFALGKGFLTEAVDITTPSDKIGPALYVGYYTLKAVGLFIPNFAATMPADPLVEGMYIPWRRILLDAGATSGARILLTLAAGCLIFHKRELAVPQT